MAYKKAFNDFKIRHGKTITARNYLLHLYEQVFVLYPNLYSALDVIGAPPRRDTFGYRVTPFISQVISYQNL
jgi:hypothetical protein